jgi:hypothetical protein
MVWYIMKHLDLKAVKFTSKKKIDEKHLARYPLGVGEVVKFGRVAYKVTKIFNNNIKINKQGSVGNLDIT